MIDKRDLYDFKQQYPETIDFIDDKVEYGFDNLTKLNRFDLNKLVSCLLNDNRDLIYDIDDLHILLADQIKAPNSVYSNNNSIVDGLISKCQNMLNRMFELVSEDQKVKYNKSYAESLQYSQLHY